MPEYSGRRVQDIFSEVTRTYEFVNHVLTGGLDRYWRRRAAERASGARDARWLDVCTGTGDMARCLARRAGPGTLVVAADFSIPMMKKAVEQSGGMPVVFAGAVSSALPFRSEAFDLVIISFATRNINVNRESLLAGFREFHRVLKPGGRFVNLETSQPPSRFLRTLFHTYVRLVVARVGGFISGSKAGYSYLSNTLVRFYGAEELARMFCEAGFSRVGFRRLTGGIVAVHEAAKESPGIGSTSGNRQ